MSDAQLSANGIDRRHELTSAAPFANVLEDPALSVSELHLAFEKAFR